VKLWKKEDGKNGEGHSHLRRRVRTWKRRKKKWANDLVISAEKRGRGGIFLS